MTNDPAHEHRAEHRTAEDEPLQHRAFSPLALRPLPAPDPRTDRRKFLIPDPQVETIVDACRRGVSEVRIARALGVNYRTWMRVRSEDERIAGALAEARKVEEDELVSLLMDKARGGETTAIIFALKGRHGYRDQGTPPPAVSEARLNVIINLPAAQPSLDAYVQAIEGEVIR